MTISEDLIEKGILGQDPDPGYVQYTATVRLKRSTVDAGGLDKFAERFGWTPMLKQFDDQGVAIRDSEGNILMEPNPLPSYKGCEYAINKFIADNAMAIVDYELQDEVKNFKEEKRKERLTAMGFDEVKPLN